MSLHTAIIGAGIGGLAAACRLAKDGHQVTVFERNGAPGGKMNRVTSQGYYFDTGPSLLTMPHVLEELFHYCGYETSEWLETVELEPGCRYFFADGTEFNIYSKMGQTLDELQRIAPEDITAYQEFLEYAANLYRKTQPAFIDNPLQEWRDIFAADLKDVLSIDAFTTVSKRVDSYFSSPYLRQLFKRFTTYNGSSPYQAPATLNVIPHVELNQGSYYVKGGIYAIAQSLEKMAKTLGVQFHYNTPVTGLVINDTNVEGITTGGPGSPNEHPFDRVVANSDATETYLELVSEGRLSTRKKEKIASIEPSCSGFVLLLGIDRTYEQLCHHNIFFSSQYEEEFRQIFREKKMPDDPTIYVVNTSLTDHGHAPEGHSNLFILVNAPYLTDEQNWYELSKTYAGHIINELEKRGLDGLERHIRFQSVITPRDFYQRYRSNRGSIYGTSSNSRWAAFRRPKNKSPYFENLYLVGGSTHPGGGIPLVLLSAKHAHTLMKRN